MFRETHGRDVRGIRLGVTSAEVVVAMLILGLIAAIAIPRIGRVAAAEASATNELRHELRVLRTAIELYHRDHGAWPGNASGAEELSPEDAARLLEQQLTGRTDANGSQSAAETTNSVCGPYLREPWPACSLGPARGCRAVLVRWDSNSPQGLPDTPEFGWVYNRFTGEIVVNCVSADERGIRYDQY